MATVKMTTTNKYLYRIYINDREYCHIRNTGKGFVVLHPTGAVVGETHETFLLAFEEVMTTRGGVEEIFWSLLEGNRK
jgi:hypothetical protein